MKIFTNKSIWKKLIIALIIVLLFQAVIMKPVHADVVEFGGKLISPIVSLIVTLCDGLMDIMSGMIMGADTTLVEVEMGSDGWDFWGPMLIAIVAAAVFIAAVALTGGAVAALTAITVAPVGIGTVVAGVAVGLYSGVWFSDQMMPDDLYLPIYTYSAEEIFKDNIFLFNANFFDEGKEIYAKLSDDAELKLSDYADETALMEEVAKHSKTEEVTQAAAEAGTETIEKVTPGRISYYFYKERVETEDTTGNIKEDDDGKYREIKTSKQDSAAMLRKTISTWYNALRNICLVLMLSVLVYIGIRMLLSSVAAEKSKYVTMLKDWFIGLCLLFLMHYIMAFSVTLVEKLTDVVKKSVGENGYVVVMEAEGGKDGPLCQKVIELQQEETITEKDGITYVNWPTNLMGSLRLQLQMEQYGAKYIGLAICFVILSLFTLYFTITYLKRVIHMAFLTLIAPMVALTYCIDKLNDGQAQGFNKWLKEYIFNLLIQPMHLLLYYILVTSAFELAGKNVIYSIVAIGFMIPAEKLLRSLFGFEKAQTAPILGPAGAMVASSALNSLLHKGPKGQGGKGESIKEENSENVPRLNNSPDPIEILKDSEEKDKDSHKVETKNDDYWVDYAKKTGIDIRDSYKTNTYQEKEDSDEQADEKGRKLAQDSDKGKISDDKESKLPQIDTKGDTKGEQAKKKKIKKPESNPKSPSRRKRAWDSYWTAQSAAIRNAPRHFKRKIENSHPIRTIGKVAAGTALGAAAGVAGIAIAASTGDVANVTKIGLASAGTGFALGSGRAQAMKTTMQDEVVRDVYKEAYYKGEKGKYKELAMDDYVQEYLKDIRNRNYFEQKFGKEEAKEMLKKGGDVETCLYNDINDRKEIAAICKLKRDKSDDTADIDTVEKAIAVSQLSQMIGSDTNNMTTKKRDEWKTRLSDMAGASHVKDKEKFAQARLREIDKFNDFKK